MGQEVLKINKRSKGNILTGPWNIVAEFLLNGRIPKQYAYYLFVSSVANFGGPSFQNLSVDFIIVSKTNYDFIEK